MKKSTLSLHADLLLMVTKPLTACEKQPMPIFPYPTVKWAFPVPDSVIAANAATVYVLCGQ